MSTSEFLIGQLVVLKDLISSDPAGLVPVDDTTNAAVVYKPDGTSAAPSPVNHGTTGNYSAQYTLDQSGWWEVVFTSTGTGAGKGRARFWVQPVP